MSLNRNAIFILIALVLFNFSTHAHFDKGPKNAHEFELIMAEHSIGVGVTMKFMLMQPEIMDPLTSPFKFLLQHRDLIRRRAKQHDLSKFSHTPEFVQRYYPEGVDSKLSEPLFESYGKNVHGKTEGLSADEVIRIARTKQAIKQINEIDDKLLNELLEDYSKQKDLSEDEQKRLRQELHNFEHAADLLNRKMFEDVYRYRRNVTAKNIDGEILEMGHRFLLNSEDIYHWQSQTRSKELALKFYHSPTLRYLILNIDANRVVNLHTKQTKDSSLIPETDTAERDNTRREYLENRAEIKSKENLKFVRQYRGVIVPYCKIFYSF